jgi:hypothetical protein
MKFVIAALAAVTLLAYDHASNGHTFPSRVYCWMGAGTSWSLLTRMPVRGAGFSTETFCVHRSLLRGWGIV